MTKIHYVFTQRSFLAILLIGVLVIGISPIAWAAQMDVFINPSNPTSPFQMKYQRTIFIDYKNGGEFADLFRGADWVIEKKADINDPGVQQLRAALNQKFVTDGSSTQISDLNVEYTAHATGRADSISVDYKVILKGTLSGYTIREAQGQSPAIVDMGWRGMTVQGPFIIDGVEVNQPISALSANAPQAYSKIIGTPAEALLSQSLIDSEPMKLQPLSNWHFLFDPTGINVDASTFGLADEIKGHVVSAYTMGESSIREGRQVEKTQEVPLTLDQPYNVRTVQSADSANIRVIGFGAIDKLEGVDIVGVTPTAPAGSGTTSTGGFPVGIIYGMAGMAAIGAVAFFVFSNRQLKKEEGQGQTGIDPSRLRAYQTSSASGGYQTVRGEAQLIDDTDYQKTRSVYDEQKQDESSSASSSRGSMPKGWKPE